MSACGQCKLARSCSASVGRANSAGRESCQEAQQAASAPVGADRTQWPGNCRSSCGRQRRDSVSLEQRAEAGLNSSIMLTSTLGSGVRRKHAEERGEAQNSNRSQALSLWHCFAERDNKVRAARSGPRTRTSDGARPGCDGSPSELEVL